LLRRTPTGTVLEELLYDADTSDDDERGYRLDRHTFATGEYVTLHGQQEAHTFRVVDVVPAADA
jgi:hypothetical protein